MNEENNKENKERFCNILTATARENMDYVLEDLQDMGFSMRRHRRPGTTATLADLSPTR